MVSKEVGSPKINKGEPEMLTDIQKANVRKWIEALRSNMYAQCVQRPHHLIAIELDGDTDTLEEDFTYSCLGVYGAVFEYEINPHIHNPEKWLALNFSLSYDDFVFLQNIDYDGQVFLDEVRFQEETGMSIEDGQKVLIRMYDNGASFEEIASVLEIYIETGIFEKLEDVRELSKMQRLMGAIFGTEFKNIGIEYGIEGW